MHWKGKGRKGKERKGKRREGKEREGKWRELSLSLSEVKRKESLVSVGRKLSEGDKYE